MWQAMDEFRTAMTGFTTQLVSLNARSVCTRETCSYRAEIDEMQRSLWFARGGGKVVVFLVCGV
jgi:hypothetical protein